MGGVEIRRDRQAIVAGESVDKDKLQLGMAAKRRKGSEVPGEEGGVIAIDRYDRQQGLLRWRWCHVPLLIRARYAEDRSAVYGGR